jgi:Tfp pilus assembly protein PilE
MILVAIFAILAVICVVAFGAQISRRRRYERGEYDPDDV